MAVVRTFDPKIDLAGAYLGGQQVQLGRERIAQQAAEAGARINLGYAQLQQEAIANEMQLAARKELLSREALQKAQEAEIEKSYKETQFGLARRRLEQDELGLQRQLQEAARGLEAEQNYGRVRADLIASGVPERDASEQAMRQVGFGSPGFSSALNEANEPSPRKYNAIAGLDPLGLNPPSRLQMTAPEFQSFLQTAPPELRTNTVNTAIEQMLQPPAGFNVTNAPVASGGGIPTVTTKAEFDALPKGAEYIGKNGKRYRKP